MNRFTPGRRFKSRGQRYEILGTTDHMTRDDRWIEMIRYKSTCAHPGCNRPFVAKTTKTRLRRGQLNKRCDRHHAPGLPAPVQKARKAAVKSTRPRKRKLAPISPRMSLEELERARLVWKADLAVRRGRRPSYLD